LRDQLATLNTRQPQQVEPQNLTYPACDDCSNATKHNKQDRQVSADLCETFDTYTLCLKKTGTQYYASYYASHKKSIMWHSWSCISTLEFTTEIINTAEYQVQPLPWQPSRRHVSL